MFLRKKNFKEHLLFIFTYFLIIVLKVNYINIKNN